MSAIGPQYARPGETMPVVPHKTIETARDAYASQYGKTVVANTWLQVAVVALSFSTIGLAFTAMQFGKALANTKPRYVRIDSVGRADVIHYDDLNYRPAEPEIKHFLGQIVHDYFARNRYTVRSDRTRVLYFLDRELGQQRIAAEKRDRQTDAIESGSVAQSEVDVTNVVLTDVKSSPYRALVYYDVRPLGTDTERVEKHVATINYTFEKTIPNDVIPVNPIGLVVVSIRDDQSFVK